MIHTHVKTILKGLHAEHLLTAKASNLSFYCDACELQSRQRQWQRFALSGFFSRTPDRSIRRPHETWTRKRPRNIFVREYEQQLRVISRGIALKLRASARILISVPRLSTLALLFAGRRRRRQKLSSLFRVTYSIIDIAIAALLSCESGSCVKLKLYVIM